MAGSPRRCAASAQAWRRETGQGGSRSPSPRSVLDGPWRPILSSMSMAATVPVRRRHHGAGYHSTDARLPSRAPSMSRPPLRVGVLGAGTVGSAVLDGLLHHADRLVTADGAPLKVVAVAVRDVARSRGDGLTADLLTD